MKCQRLPGRIRLADAWHRLWCAKCRAWRSVDAVIARGVAQMQNVPVPPESLARTLAALGLRSTQESPAIPVTRRAPHPVKTRRIVLVAGALTLVFLLFGPLLSTRRDSVDAVLAQAMDALSQVHTLHLIMTESYDDVQHTYENWIQLPDKRRDETKGGAYWVYEGQRALLFRPFEAPPEVLIEQPSDIRFSPEEILQATGVQRWFERRWKSARVVTREVIEPGSDGFRLLEMQADDPGSEAIEFYRLRIDRDSHLVLESEFWLVRRRDGQVTYRMMIGPIEYNVSLPDRLFDTTLPQGAKQFQFSTREGSRAYVEYKLRQLDQMSPERRMAVLREWKRSGFAAWTLNRLKRRNPGYYAAIQEKLKQYGLNP